MGQIGNQGIYVAANVSATSNTNLLSFTLNGKQNAFYNINKLYVCCTSGYSDFIVRLYLDSVQVGPTMRTKLSPSQDATIVIPDLTITMINGTNFQAKVSHFSLSLQDFESMIIGSGFA